MQVIEYIQAAAEVRASEIVSAFPAERSNWEDFRQELMIHACRQIDRHDPGRGKIKTFVSAVVENKKKSILRRLQKNRRELKKQYGVEKNGGGIE